MSDNSKKPAVAARKEALALANYISKLEILEKIASNEMSDSFPKRISLPSFCAWTDEPNNVLLVSRSLLYRKDTESSKDTYLSLSKRLEAAFSNLKALRKRDKKKNSSESILHDRLKDSEITAGKYLNQYMMALQEVTDLREINLRQSEQIKRLTAEIAKLSGLNLVRSTKRAKSKSDAV
ncbi:hypothetical protein [Duganella sp. S19_KUP01_CR8]|uniref:hypothetical protein n=1 Tax=Duganella sp. S19_KUP01_CR8 TaxID=3025502 RepID=UPI002FCDA316